jgi:hypothetical protein
MKIKLFIIIILFVKICHSQEIKNLSSIYQNILNDKRYVDLILSDTTFLCYGTLFYISNNSDTTSNLTFNGQPVVIKKNNDTSECPFLSIRLNKSKTKIYKLTATVYKNLGQHGSCIFSKSITYNCTLRKKCDIYIIKNVNVNTFIRSGHLM